MASKGQLDEQAVFCNTENKKRSRQKSKTSFFKAKQGKLFSFLVILLLFLAMPATVLLSQQQQTIQQHAQVLAVNTSCPNSPSVGGMCPMGYQFDYSLCQCAPQTNPSGVPPPPGCYYHIIATGACAQGRTCQPVYELICPSGTPVKQPSVTSDRIKCGSQGLGSCVSDTSACPTGYTAIYRNDRSHACFAQLHKKGYQCCYPQNSSSPTPPISNPSGMRCGGNIQNPPQCPPGYTCQLDSIPDAGGTCVPANQAANQVQETKPTNAPCSPPTLFGIGLGWFIPGGNCNQ